MNIEYTAQIWKEGDQFVAHAMPLDVMSSGKTPEEAGKALDEAVRLFVGNCSRDGHVAGSPRRGRLSARERAVGKPALRRD